METPGATNGDVQTDDEQLEEQERLKMRPPDIDADMSEMERRKRVAEVMSSRHFRQEMERIIEQQIRDGMIPAQWAALKEMYDVSGKGVGSLQAVIPIADIRSADTATYAKGEKLLRCKLSATYRLMDLFGWSQGIYNHITARISPDAEHFLINPFGLSYNEVTASSLVKVDLKGNVIDPGTTNFGVNLAGYTIHSAIHGVRPDIRCLIHLHTPSVVAISSLKQGLLAVSQEACLLGDIAYHDYQGIVVDPDEKLSIAKDLGLNSKVMLLRNHGAVCGGETIEEAFYLTYHLVLACEAQLKLMPAGIDNLVIIPEEARQRAFEQSRRGGGGGVDSKERDEVAAEGAAPRKRKFGVGEMEFEAFMRMLDNAGYRTGYMYRRPLVREGTAKPRSDVEVPPASSSYTYVFDEEDLFRYSPLKKLLEGRRSADRSKWINSPNSYQKVEMLETNTADPKKIIKWVPDTAQQQAGTPVRVADALQFVPKNTTPKEFKQKQKQMKEWRRAGEKTAGPQSHILDGVTWDEASRAMVDGPVVSPGGDQVIMVGAASKGIIQRDYQHNAVVFRAPYAKNPFDEVTDEDLEEYRRQIERKQGGGDTTEDEDTLDAQRAPAPIAQSPPASAPPTLPREEPVTVNVQKTVLPSMEKPEKLIISEKGAEHYNGEETLSDAGEASPSKADLSTTEELSSRAETSEKKKKKKKGIRTPSFLKKKSKKRSATPTQEG